MGEPATDIAAGHASAALTRFFEHYYRARPVQATFTGIHEHDARLPDWSPEGLDEQVADMGALRRVLDGAGRVADREVRRFPEDVDRALADGFLEIQLAEYETGHFIHSNPALWTGEAIFAIIALITRAFAPLEQRLESAAGRLRETPRFLSAASRVVRAAPFAWRARAIRECKAATYLYRVSLPRWWTRLAASNQIPQSLCDELNAAAATAGAGFDTFTDWLERDLSDTRLRPDPDFLTLLLRRGHWCASPVSTLAAEAAEGLNEACAELVRRARRLASGGWSEVQEQLAATHPSVDDYLPHIERTWLACRQIAIERDLVTWPDAPIRYVFIPEHTRDVAPQLYYLFYRSPAPFDALSIHDSVVTPIDASMGPDEQRRRLRMMNASAITLNHVWHHGGLGHHVQNFYATRSRSRIGQVAAVDGANRIGMFCGGTLAEGWACYVCDLAEEQGCLTPLETVAQQHTRVRLLARAVVDLGLHSGRLTLAEAASVYRDRARMSEEAAEAERVKNSMFPGAAVMYWLGLRELHALRRTIAAREGVQFTLRSFHDRVLSYGAIPVPLIARLITSSG